MSLFHAFVAAMHGSGENLRSERLCRNVGEAYKPLLQEHFRNEFARDSCADVCECVCAKMSAIWFPSHLAFFTLSTEGARTTHLRVCVLYVQAFVKQD